MQPNLDNLLVNAEGAVIKSDVKPDKNDFVFTCTKSGVYSIELTVFDQAGNLAKARKLFIFNKDSKLKTFPENPVFVQEADPNTGYKWITKFDVPRNGGYIPLTLTWKDHFSSNARFDDSWGLPAKHWQSSDGIDDRCKDIYGRRSIYRIANIPGGISAYGVAYMVDPTGGGRGLIPGDWKWLNASSNSYQFPMSNFTDGTGVVILLRCSDVAGGTETVRLVLNIDRTPAQINTASFLANGINEYTSR